jgi:hypothetical protein
MKVYEDTVLNRPHDSPRRLIDPLSGTPNPVGEGLSIWDEFDRCGFTCGPGSKNREAGILALPKRAQARRSNMGVYPTIYVLDDLEGVDFEMRHYIWDDHTNKKTEERKDQLQTPRKKNDDYLEGIHRILLDGADYDETIEDDQDPAPASRLQARTPLRITRSLYGKNGSEFSKRTEAKTSERVSRNWSSPITNATSRGAAVGRAPRSLLQACG